MISLVYAKEKRYSPRAALCFQSPCSFGLCHQVSEKSVHAGHLGSHAGHICGCLPGFRGRVGGVRRRNGSCPSSRPLPAQGGAVQTGEQPQGSFISALAETVSRTRKALLARQALVTQLFCRIVRWSSAGSYPAVYRTTNNPRPGRLSSPS